MESSNILLDTIYHLYIVSQTKILIMTSYKLKRIHVVAFLWHYRSFKSLLCLYSSLNLVFLLFLKINVEGTFSWLMFSACSFYLEFSLLFQLHLVKVYLTFRHNEKSLSLKISLCTQWVLALCVFIVLWTLPYKENISVYFNYLTSFHSNYDALNFTKIKILFYFSLVIPKLTLFPSHNRHSRKCHHGKKENKRKIIFKYNHSQHLKLYKWFEVTWKCSIMCKRVCKTVTQSITNAQMRKMGGYQGKDKKEDGLLLKHAFCWRAQARVQ